MIKYYVLYINLRWELSALKSHLLTYKCQCLFAYAPTHLTHTLHPTLAAATTDTHTYTCIWAHTLTHT